MPAIEIERDGETVEVWVRRDDQAVIAEDMSGKEWPLTGHEEDWARQVIYDYEFDPDECVDAMDR